MIDAVTSGRVRHALAKVPEITVLFWVIKIISTGMGEATSDYLAHRFSPLAVAPFGIVLLVVALAIQLRAASYNAWRYWFAVTSVAVTGTMLADGLHVKVGLSYTVTTVGYLALLAVTFFLWFRVEGTLSIHSIYTTRRELFYWATVIATFALGTAAGDFTANTLHMGFLASGFLFLALFILPGIGFFYFGLNEVVAFWFAYVMTRPLGASFADYLGVSHHRGGIAIGTGIVAIVAGVVIVILVAVVARRDQLAAGE